MRAGVRAAVWAVEMAEDEVVPGCLGVFWSAAKTLLQDEDGMTWPGGQNLHEVALGQIWEVGAQNCGMAGAQACEQFVVVHRLLLPIFPGAAAAGGTTTPYTQHLPQDTTNGIQLS